MPSIDRLVTTRYNPAAPHPLTRRPWRRQDPRQVTEPTAAMGERVRRRLRAADQARRRLRIAQATGCSSVVIILLASEVAVLRWPHASVQTAEWVARTVGAALIVLTGLQRVRDELFGSAEMRVTAGVVTAMLLILVTIGLGSVLWSNDSRTDAVDHLREEGEEA